MACEAPGGNDGNDDNDGKKPPRETKKKNGYECEFVEPPQKQFQSECPICLQILREPHLISCYGHSYCEACIERVGKDGKPCPLCNEPGFTTMANKGLKRTLHEFRVYCPHRLHGCEWESELGRLDEHLNSDPLPERQLKGCLFAVIECLHCKEGIRRDKIAGHQLERCPKRPYMCEYCAEYKSTFEDVAHSHWPECKCFLLPCPNECTSYGSGLQRKDLDQHVKEECPLTVVQCELHHAGCKVALPRKDMADHMKNDLIAHIYLLAAENHRLSKRLLEKEEQICLLTQENAELEEKTTKQSQDLREKVTSQSQELTRTKLNMQELAQKVASQSLELTRTKQELTRTKQDLAQKAATQELTSLSQELTRTKHELKQEVTSQVRELTQELSRSKQELMQEQTRTKHELTQKVTFQAQELTRTNQELSQTKQELTRTKQDLIRTGQDLTRTKQELTRTKQELAQKVATQSQELTLVKQELTQKATSQDQKLEAKLKEAQRQAINQLQTQQQRDLQELRTDVEMKRDIVPVTIRMAGFDELKKTATRWHSRPFYTGMEGYKMCLEVEANGTVDGVGTHVSVYTCLMHGEFDSCLKWPFRGTITIQLVNQLEDKEHCTWTIPYTDTTPDGCAARVTDGEQSHSRGLGLLVNQLEDKKPYIPILSNPFIDAAHTYTHATRVTDRERSGGWGSPLFLPHSELGLSVANNRQYLKDDCLIFRIVSVKLN